MFALILDALTPLTLTLVSFRLMAGIVSGR